jgi:UDP-N-acetylglucosamine 2-epimerase (non-hydrolysing)
MKVLTIIGTRPEIIKLSETIKLLDSTCNQVIVHTGQNYDYELNKVFFEDLGLREPDYYLNAASGSAISTIGQVLIEVEKVIDSESPDAALIYGDTNSCLSSIALKKKKVPIFHMEAGNRCFDERVPEEINRRIVDHISDVNVVLSEHARRNLEREGVASNLIFKAGSPMREVLTKNKEKVQSSKILDELHLEKNGYILASIHREENTDNDSNIRALYETLLDLHGKYKVKIIVSTHPRTRKKIESLGLDTNPNGINFLKPFGFFDYISLQLHAKLVISDSGTITEETDILGLKSIMIRNAHERPEGSDAGCCVMTGVDKENILQVSDMVINGYVKNSYDQIKDYSVEDFSRVVVSLMHSYTDFINREVWKK